MHELLIGPAVLAAAWVGGALAVRARQPRVVGQLLVGMLLGPSLIGGGLDTDDRPFGGLAAVFSTDAVRLIGEAGQVGLTLLMVLVGSRLDIRAAATRGITIVGLGAGLAVVSVTAASVATALLIGTAGQPPGSTASAGAVCAGAVLVLTGLPVVAMILSDGRAPELDDAPVVLGSCAVALVLCLCVATATANSGDDLAGEGAWVVTRALGAVVGSALLGGLVGRLIGGLRRRTGRLATVLLIVGGALIAGASSRSVLSTGLVGGLAFGAGLHVGGGHVARGLVVRWWPPGCDHVGTPLLLVSTGMHVDLRAVDQVPVSHAGLLIVSVIGISLLSGWGLARSLGFSQRSASQLGVLFNCRGLVGFAGALLAVQAGAMSTAMAALTSIVAIATTVMTAPCLAWVDRSRGPHSRVLTLPTFCR